MAGPVVFCQRKLGFDIPRFDIHKKGKEIQVAIVRPVLRDQRRTNCDSTSALVNSVALSDQQHHGSLSQLQSNGTESDYSSSGESPEPTGHSNSDTSVFIYDSATDERRRYIRYPERALLYYYPNLTMREAKRLLKPHPEGTFLLRDSSDPRFAYSLSVKTNRGTTSVRILRTDSGQFRLDCDPTQQDFIPSFQTVSQLISHYLERGSGNGNCCGNHRYVFLESTGRMDTPVLMYRPLLRNVLPLSSSLSS